MIAHVFYWCGKLRSSAVFLRSVDGGYLHWMAEHSLIIVHFLLAAVGGIYRPGEVGSEMDVVSRPIAS